MSVSLPLSDELFRLNHAMVRGATREDQAEALFGLVRWFRPMHCVEVGSFHGFTTAWIARAIQCNGIGRLWAIDSGVNPWSDLNALQYNLERLGVDGCVTLLLGDHKSVEWPAQVDYCHVDGAHSDEACMWDLEEAVRRGAWLITLHDTTIWWGPAEVLGHCRENAEADWDILEDERDCGMTVIKRRTRPADKRAPIYTRETHPDGDLKVIG